MSAGTPEDTRGVGVVTSRVGTAYILANKGDLISMNALHVARDRAVLVHVGALDDLVELREYGAQLARERVQGADLRRVGGDEREHERRRVHVDEHHVLEECRDAVHSPELELAHLRESDGELGVRTPFPSGLEAEAHLLGGAGEDGRQHRLGVLVGHVRALVRHHCTRASVSSSPRPPQFGC